MTTAFQLISFDKIFASNIKLSVTERSFMEVWQGYANKAFTNPAKQLARRIPELITDHPEHPEMKLIDIVHMPPDPRMPNECKVSLFWSNQVQLGDGLKVDAVKLALEYNPLKEPAYVDYKTWTAIKIWETDISPEKKPFATTAGEQILHQEEVEYAAWHIEVKVPKYPKIFGSPKNGSQMFINSDSVKFAGEKWEPNTLLIRGIGMGRMSIKNDFVYYPLAFDVLFNPDTWLVKKRNAGFLCLMPVRQSNRPGSSPIYVMKPTPIKVGNPPQYPVQPIPIQNEPTKQGYGNYNTKESICHGTLFKEFRIKDANGNFTGATDVTELTPQRLKEIWKKTELTFQTKTAIKFTNNVPLS